MPKYAIVEPWMTADFWWWALKWSGPAMPTGYEASPSDLARFCALASHDSLKLPCTGRIEAIHYLGRQRIRNAPIFLCADPGIIALAEWDPRNGGAGCTGHHRRLDNQGEPALEIPFNALPERVIECANERGLEDELRRKFK